MTEDKFTNKEISEQDQTQEGGEINPLEFSELQSKVNKIDKHVIDMFNKQQSQIDALEAKQISDRIKKIASRQEELQESIDFRATQLEGIIRLADLETRLSRGVVPDSVRIVPGINLEGGKFTVVFNKLIRFLTRVLILGLWLVIGMYLWLPLLFRSVIIYTSKLTVSMFANSDMSRAQQGLYQAITFYTGGFVKINQLFSSTPIDKVEEEQLDFGETSIILLQQFILSTMTYALFIFGSRWAKDFIRTFLI